ncbi:MAG: hypothetical protein K0S63_28 [Gammaproteobacteria bacterium]|nr:hypothetical protein [Gammaproteobacteria bacterium]
MQYSVVVGNFETRPDQNFHISRRYRSMKLKLVVASMSVLGMISCPVFAATQSNTAKHKHHKVHQQKATVVQSYKGEEVRYKGEETLVANDWYNRIAVDGGINFDTKWGNRRMGYEGENNQRISLNDIHLNVTALVNDWVKAFASFSYDNASQVLPSVGTLAANQLASRVPSKPGKYDNIKDSIGSVVIEQAYVKIANANQAPVYLTLGKQFVDFGKYNLHPLAQPLTQVMSETLRNAATIGFTTGMVSPLDLFGSAYVFDSPYKQQLAATTDFGGTVPVVVPALTGSSQGHPKPIYGARLGIGQTNDSLSWDLSADYISNMIGVNGVAYAVGIFNGSNLGGEVGNNGTATGGTYENRVGGFALNGDIKTGPFDLELRYVTALQTFNVYDLSKNVYPTASLSTKQGAKPWAAGVNAGYVFNAWDKNQNVYLGYQGTQNAVNLFLPQSRWVAGYGIDVLKNTNVGVELDHDIDYSVSNGGTGNSNNQIGLRVAVKFG